MESPESEQNPYTPPEAQAMPSRLKPKVSVPLAIFLGVLIVGGFVINPGLGIGMLLISLPAYVRSASESVQRASAGEELTTTSRLISFVGSVAVVAACAVAGAIAFAVTCTGALLVAVSLENKAGGEFGFILVLVASVLGFLVAFGVLYKVCWPRLRKRS